MSYIERLTSRDGLAQAIAGLEEIAEQSPVMSVAAIYILKNELGEDGGERQKVIEEHRFSLPGGLAHRLVQRLRRRRQGLRRALAGLLREGREWLRGGDSEAFRDRCDRAFFEEVAPVVEERFGALAEPLLNTVNEAIINYAEYSFPRWAIRRRVLAHVFLTDRDLAYAIVRPSASRLNRFDPLTLARKTAGPIRRMKRGWGHTLLMERALFISFDQAPHGRGLMIVVGDDRELRGEGE